MFNIKYFSSLKKTVCLFSDSGFNIKEKYRILSSRILFILYQNNKVKNFVCAFKMTPQMDLLQPPEHVRGMKELDVARFQKNITVPYLKIDYLQLKALKEEDDIRKYMLQMSKLKGVQTKPEENTLELLLNPNLIKSWVDFDAGLIKKFDDLKISAENLHSKSILLTFDNWIASNILKAILPADQPSLTSFSNIGHIVHVNIKDHLLEYKKIIGQVLLLKVSTAKTVVNKVNKIENKYRNFEMEVLCGENNTIVQVCENHHTYELDFATVYWNPRLSTEHQRIVNLLQPSDVLFDVFCGIGPFSIPAAKKLCRVFANDLNPESVKWLNKNIKLNKIKEEFIEVYNLDGVDFICSQFKIKLLELWKDGITSKIHITMNLPANSLDFIKFYQGLISKSDIEGIEIDFIQKSLPQLHVYFFVHDKAGYEHFEEVTGWKLLKDEYKVHHVRKVSREKDMCRLSFDLPLRYFLQDANADESEPPVKRLCVS